MSDDERTDKKTKRDIEGGDEGVGGGHMREMIGKRGTKPSSA